MKKFTVPLGFAVLTAVLMMALFSCERPTAADYQNPYDPGSEQFVATPGLSTRQVSEVLAMEARSGGTFTNDYGSPVTQKGVCWSTSENPTTEDNCTIDGDGHGNFDSHITRLQAATRYFVRAYASNAEGTVYGEQHNFTTMSGLTEFEISNPFDITATSGRIDVEVKGDGGAPLLDWGVCVGTQSGPTIQDLCLSAGSQSNLVARLAGSPVLNSGSGVVATPGSQVEHSRNSGIGSDDTHHTEEGTTAGDTGNLTRYNELPGSGNPGIVTHRTGSQQPGAPWPAGMSQSAGGIPMLGSLSDGQSEQKSVRGESGLTLSMEAAASGERVTFNVENIQAGIRYYIRAYGYNEAVSHHYSEERSFTTFTGIADVTTGEVTSITAFTAVAGGNVISGNGAPVTGRGVCLVEGDGQPGLGDKCITSGQGLGEFSVTLSELMPQKSYSVRAYAITSLATSWGEVVRFSTRDGLPVITTQNITSITAFSAVAGGQVLQAGDASVTERGVCYSQTGTPGLEDQCVASGSGTGGFTVTLDELRTSNNYFVRAYATSAAGTGWGEVVSFSTLSGIADVTTGEVTSITAFTAVAGGNVISGNGAPVTGRGVCLVEGDGQPGLGDKCITSGQGLGEFSVTLSELMPQKSYSVRAYAITSLATSWGEVVRFSTRDGLPVITTQNITSITAFSAVAGGQVLQAGDASVTERGVCYSQTGTPGLEDQCVASGSGTGGFTVTLDELRTSNNYFVRAYATSAAGTGWGEVVSFSTLSGIADVTTGEVTSITAFTAVAGGNVISGNGAPVTGRGVCLVEGDGQPGLGDKCITSGQGLGEFSVTLSELMPQKSYSVRAYATNAVGTDYGDTVSFTTRDGVITLTTSEASSIGVVSATVAGNISDDGGAAVTARGVVWSTTENPTVDSNSGITSDGTGTGSFESSISGLTGSTTYYARAYATNSVGTAYGEQRSFTTLAASGGGRDTETILVNVTNPATGRVWMDRNLGASRAATSSTDDQAYGDLYQWGRAADGHQKRTSSTTTTLSSGDQPGHGSFILAPNTPNDWRSPQNNNLWQGVNGINNPCPVGYRLPTEAEWNAELGSWSSNNSAGAFASPLKLPRAGQRVSSTGSFFSVGSNGYYWSSSVSGSSAGLLVFNIIAAVVGTDYPANGFSIRCLNNELMLPTVSTTAVSSVTTSAAVTGGNVTADGNAAVTARGVVWSTTENPTVDSNSGITSNGSGTGVFSSSIGGLNGSTTYYVRAYVTNSAGTAYGSQQSFTTLARVVGGGRETETSVVNVTNPATGRVWMDRNLGASRAATSSTDAEAYGDLYQWGRAADGHQKRTSSTTTTLSSGDQPGHGSFILAPNTPNDWRSPQNNNLWQGVNGINNPCPVGYRLPTEAEWNAELGSWSSNNSAGAFASPLKLPLAGYRGGSSGSLFDVGSGGYYWSSSVSGTSARRLGFGSSGAGLSSLMTRANGFSIRCLNNELMLPTVSTTAVSSVTTSAAVSGGNVTADGNAAVTARGVVWSTTQNPTVDSNSGITSNGTGTGSFESSIGGLTGSTTYYVRAYATNSVGTAYGSQQSFTTLARVVGGGRDTETTVVEVTNPATGRVWMDRNLGASRAATSSTDDQAYGDLYQWGRAADGHQKRTSATTTTLSSGDQPGHGSFIVAPTTPFDWRNPQNDNLWQGVNGINNPCPVGLPIAHGGRVEC
jgi:uncharacterized protein (TIGR02145 family)